MDRFTKCGERHEAVSAFGSREIGIINGLFGEPAKYQRASAFDSGSVAPGNSFSLSLLQKGTYSYYGRYIPNFLAPRASWLFGVKDC